MAEAADSAAAGSGSGLRPKLAVAISLIALAGCIWWASGQEPPELPDSPAAIVVLVAAIAVYLVGMLARGLRWSVILHHAGIETDRAEPYALTLVGYMGNSVLPLRGGEVLRVVLLHERWDVGWARSVGSIIPERVLDVCSLAILLAAVVASGAVVIPGGSTVAIIGVGLVLAGAGALLLYRRLRRLGHFDRFAGRLRPFAEASRPLLTRTGLWLGALSVGIWLLDGTVLWMVAQSLDLPIGIIEAIGLAVTVTAFSLIPAGPAYAGTYDAALLVGLEALGISGGAAVGYVLLARFVIFVPVTLIGLVIVLTRYGGIGRLRRALASGRTEEAEQDEVAVGGEPAPGGKAAALR